MAEIREIARDLLVKKGAPAVTVNAVARKMGMSGPALYRYYPSQGDLIEAVRSDLYSELVAALTSARDGSGADRPERRLLAISRGLREWAIAHPTEFGCLFATPASPAGPERCANVSQTGRAFGQVFLEEIVAIWRTRRFPLPSIEDMDPSLAAQLRAYSEKIEGALPPEAAYIFLSCWMRLYGLLCMEVLNQIGFAYSDLSPVFEECLQDLCRLLDIPYEAPST
ncbi:TetR/AcrR family transcriptional regulator [Chelativorans sp. AA-79]|uniref:TetR/AcrR family transcriptional regulator n=1 Tax=Chelativorans sp. AA-79 TaxID=3028735 RepID=UPI0023F70EB5|nr:TetR/AcrR family transcriptional regulator [Chelativorans sp. AA-79]WEX08123.1 TetR/AcrR family transcriptional regulator [Chelativorans sp. AA-79]